MEYNYKDCLRFVEEKLRVSLFPYQKQMLKAFCEGKEVRSARCVVRTYVAKAFGQYVSSLCDKNDYNKTPDIVFPYSDALEYGLIDQHLIDRAKTALSLDDFRREYLCE